jgi:hypothetical protein
MLWLAQSVGIQKGICKIILILFVTPDHFCLVISQHQVRLT